MKSHFGFLLSVSAAAAIAAITGPRSVWADTSLTIVNPNFSEVYSSATNYNASLGDPVLGTTAPITNGNYSAGWGATTFNQALSYSDGSTSSSGYIPGWTGTGSTGEQSVGSYTAGPNPNPGGTNGYAVNTTFSQTLSTNITPGATYLLTASVDERLGGVSSAAPSGQSAILQVTAAGTALSGGTYLGLPGGYQQAPNTMAELVTAPTNSSGALGITLGSANGQMDFYNVQLVQNPTSVPTNLPVFYNNGLVVNNLGTTAPTPGASDQSNLNPTGTVGPESASLNYYTNNTGGTPAIFAVAPGQSFTTGTASSYKLNSVTILDADEHGGFASGATLALDIMKVSGTSYTLIGVVAGSVPITTSAGTGDYLQFALNAPIALNGDTTYAYSIASTNGYSGLGTDTNPDYAQGQLALFNPSSFNGNAGSLLTSSAVPSAIFDVSLTAVPEPAGFGIFALGGIAMLLLARKNKARV